MIISTCNVSITPCRNVSTSSSIRTSSTLTFRSLTLRYILLLTGFLSNRFYIAMDTSRRYFPGQRSPSSLTEGFKGARHDSGDVYCGVYTVPRALEFGRHRLGADRGVRHAGCEAATPVDGNIPADHGGHERDGVHVSFYEFRTAENRRGDFAWRPGRGTPRPVLIQACRLL